MSDDLEYVLGTDDAELARLGFQHQVWAAHTSRAWERAGFRRGDRLLDIGSGPGYGTLDLARLVGPDGRILAVDGSARFVRHLEAECRRRGVHHVDVRHQNLESLDLDAGSIDGAFARWVLCYLPDPGAVIAQVARALRPGRALAVMDYCRYEGFAMAPASEAVQAVIAAVARSFRTHGGNPDVGLDLPAHMHRAGLEVRSVRPLVRVGRPGTALWEWPGTFFENYLPTLVEMGEITDAERRAFERDWRDRARSRDSWFLSPPMVEVIGVKPA